MLPFSAGPRKCIGESFARIEMQIHLMTIAKHLRLRSDSEQSIQLEAGVNLRNKHDFIMTPEIIPSEETLTKEATPTQRQRSCAGMVSMALDGATIRLLGVLEIEATTNQIVMTKEGDC